MQLRDSTGPTAPRSESASPTHKSKGRALALDDSRAHRMIAKKYLDELGFEVVEAADGADALAQLDRNPDFDVLLVDWEMPGMSGIEFIRAVRARPRFQQIPIIMVTAVVAIERICEAVEAGANEYIMKPFTKVVLALKLDILKIPHS